MADPQPRTRTARQVADDAGDLLHDVQELARVLPATAGELAPVLAVLKRLAAQVEDLAAALGRERARNDDLHDQRQ
jgi:hypothetical protein